MNWIRLSDYSLLLHYPLALLLTTAVRDKDEAMLRHVEDSLALLASVEAHGVAKGEALRLIDVGSGGGLPGLILAIARPEW